ncbi:MAG: sensory histidine kinase AtoS [Sphingobacteriales bacterium]|nr:sensory histidine kinase AtoS [Sphingobacteriales bacterium]
MNHSYSPVTIQEETLRLDAVRRYTDLSVNKEKHLDEIVKLASELCSTPIALITLIDETKQHFIAKVGLDMEGITREESFCTQTIKQDDIMMVPDSQLDDVFVNNPLVTGPPHIRFYAGIPLENFEGHKIGSLCVIDRKPKTLTNIQKDSLRVLSKQVISNIELRQSLKLVIDQKKIIDDAETSHKEKIVDYNEQLKNLIQLQSHQIRGHVTSLKGLIYLTKNEQPAIKWEYIYLLETVINQLDDEIHEIVDTAFKSIVNLSD